jgi:hypothetical protein
MTVSPSEAFIASSEPSLRLIPCFLRDGVIGRLFGHCDERTIEGSKIKLYGAAYLMETIKEESEADRSESS